MPPIRILERIDSAAHSAPRVARRWFRLRQLQAEIDSAAKDLTEAKRNIATARANASVELESWRRRGQEATERYERARRSMNKWAALETSVEAHSVLSTLERSLVRAEERASRFADMPAQDIDDRMRELGEEFVSAKRMVAAAMAHEKRLAKWTAEQAECPSEHADLRQAIRDDWMAQAQAVECLKQRLRSLKGVLDRLRSAARIAVESQWHDDTKTFLRSAWTALECTHSAVDGGKARGRSRGFALMRLASGLDATRASLERSAHRAARELEEAREQRWLAAEWGQRASRALTDDQKAATDALAHVRACERLAETLEAANLENRRRFEEVGQEVRRLGEQVGRARSSVAESRVEGAILDRIDATLTGLATLVASRAD
jgi:hypothetical protein